MICPNAFSKGREAQIEDFIIHWGYTKSWFQKSLEISLIMDFYFLGWFWFGILTFWTWKILNVFQPNYYHIMTVYANIWRVWSPCWWVDIAGNYLPGCQFFLFWCIFDFQSQWRCQGTSSRWTATLRTSRKSGRWRSWCISGRDLQEEWEMEVMVFIY